MTDADSIRTDGHGPGRAFSAQTSSQPLDARGEVALGFLIISIATLLLTGVFVWPELFFGAFAQREMVLPLSSLPMVRDESGYAMNRRFGFRDDQGKVHLLYDEWQRREYNQTNAFASSGRTSSGNPRYAYSGEVEFVPGYPFLRRPGPTAAYLPKRDRDVSSTLSFDFPFSIHMICASYIIAFVTVRVMRRRRSRPQAAVT